MAADRMAIILEGRRIHHCKHRSEERGGERHSWWDNHGSRGEGGKHGLTEKITEEPCGTKGGRHDLRGLYVRDYGRWAQSQKLGEHLSVLITCGFTKFISLD